MNTEIMRKVREILVDIDEYLKKLESEEEDRF